MSAPLVVHVTHSFSAAPERVFDAWLKPDMIGTFMFGPRLREEQIIHLKTDPRIGGAFSFLVKRGGMEIDHFGTYREIARPRRLVFTWGIAGASADESMVEIDIVATARGCELTLTHNMDPKWAEFADRTRMGWTTMLSALGRFFDEQQQQQQQ
jgi:uncharacterized protein YndB with AHSA1/START domain